MAEQDKCRKHIFISGSVQGVGFRFFTYGQAKALNLRGFVKNLPDGRVEVLIEGSKRAVNELTRHLRKGPSFSKVTNMDIIEEEYSNAFDDFRIRLHNDSIIL